MAAFDPKRYKHIEEKADSLLDRLKASPHTALIFFCAGALLGILGILAIL